MANGHNLIISYDLNAPAKNYQAVADAIQMLGASARPLLSYWFVDSILTAKDAAKAVWAAMDQNDRLMVVDAKTNDAYWYNLSQTDSDFLQKRWNQ